MSLPNDQSHISNNRNHILNNQCHISNGHLFEHSTNKHLIIVNEKLVTKFINEFQIPGLKFRITSLTFKQKTISHFKMTGKKMAKSNILKTGRSYEVSRYIGSSITRKIILQNVPLKAELK